MTTTTNSQDNQTDLLTNQVLVTGEDESIQPIDTQVEIDFNIVEDWNGGFKAELDLTSSQDIEEGWQLTFTAPFEITEIYGAEILSHEGDIYTLGNLDWNKQLTASSPQQIILINNDFGQPAQEATNYEFMVMSEAEQPPTDGETGEEPLLATSEFNIIEDWNGGFKAELDFSSSQDIEEGWQLSFTAPFEITEIYGAEIISHEGDLYTIGNLDWNEQIDADTEQQVILIANDFGQPAQEATNFELMEVDGSTPTPDPDPNPNPDPDPTPNPSTGQFNYGEAIQKSFLFFEANRSGDLPDDNRLEWRGDSANRDGSDVGRDLTGGYYDAGDHVKFGQTIAMSMSTLAWGGVEYQDAYQRSGQWDELLEAVKWGTDYMLKAHVTENGKTKEFWAQVGDGELDHAYWGSPEEMTMARPSFKIDASNPGTDLAADSAAALAAASMLFRESDAAYADELLNNAKQLYEFAETYLGKYSDSVAAANPYYTSWSGYEDELAYGAAMLHKATGNQAYLDKAENYYDSFGLGPGDWTLAADDKTVGATVLLAQSSDDSKYAGQVEDWLDIWINGDWGVDYTEGGLAWRNSWASLPLAAGTAFMAGVYNDTVREDGRYDDFVMSQVDYILGDNPADFSYMVGFGDNYATHVHHRAADGNSYMPSGEIANQHILYGALVGGPKSANDFDYEDRQDDWIGNEVGISYNAPLQGALAYALDHYGGNPLTDSQLDALPGVDANGTGI